MSNVESYIQKNIYEKLTFHGISLNCEKANLMCNFVVATE